MKLFLDVETTGLDPQNDEILSLTMIEYDYKNNVFRTCFNGKFKPSLHLISYSARYTSGKWKSLSFVYSDLLGHPFKNTHTSIGDTLALIEVTMALYPQSFRVDAYKAFEVLNEKIR